MEDLWAGTVFYATYIGNPFLLLPKSAVSQLKVENQQLPSAPR